MVVLLMALVYRFRVISPTKITKRIFVRLSRLSPNVRPDRGKLSLSVLRNVANIIPVKILKRRQIPTELFHTDFQMVLLPATTPPRVLIVINGGRVPVAVLPANVKPDLVLFIKPKFQPPVQPANIGTARLV